MREEKDKNDEKSSLPPAVSRKSRQIPQNTKKEDKLRSCEAGPKRWVKNLLEYSKCLNNDKLEELGWRSAFEVYYGRKSNELVKCGVTVNREKKFNVQKVIQPPENFVYERQKRVDEERENSKNTKKKVCDRTVEYYWKRTKCSKYKKGEEVFIRYGKKNGKKVPKQRFVMRGNQSR